MALQKNINLIDTYINQRTGETIEKEKSFPNAYIKITNYKGNKEYTKIAVTIYENSNKDKQLFVKEFTFAPSMENKNFIQQGYEYLKTLPEFADAVDC